MGLDELYRNFLQEIPVPRTLAAQSFEAFRTRQIPQNDALEKLPRFGVRHQGKFKVHTT